MRITSDFAETDIIKVFIDGVEVHNGPNSLDAIQDTPAPAPMASWPRTVDVTEEQARALEKVVEIDRTSKVSHGGLKGLLGISDAQVLALAGLVEALRK